MFLYIERRDKPVSYSVLMSVYYKEKPEYLKAAIESIIAQSKKTDDFILVCDGPLTKELDAVIELFQAKYNSIFHVYRLSKNCGLGAALNYGISMCKNDIVARMDSDDIAMKCRCELQFDFLEHNPSIAILSGKVLEFYDDVSSIIGVRNVPATHEEICRYSKKRNPFNHPCVMYRKHCVMNAGGYSEEFHLFEDYHLWMKMLMMGYQGANLEEPLLYMRTPRAFYKRRGGLYYAKDMLRFHKWIYRTKWTNCIDFCTGAIPHAIVCLLPNTARKIIYGKLHGQESE